MMSLRGKTVWGKLRDEYDEMGLDVYPHSVKIVDL